MYLSLQDDPNSAPKERLRLWMRFLQTSGTIVSMLRDWFCDLHYSDEVQTVVFAFNRVDFCSDGDMYDIIGQ